MVIIRRAARRVAPILLLTAASLLASVATADGAAAAAARTYAAPYASASTEHVELGSCTPLEHCENTASADAATGAAAVSLRIEPTVLSDGWPSLQAFARFQLDHTVVRPARSIEVIATWQIDEAHARYVRGSHPVFGTSQFASVAASWAGLTASHSSCDACRQDASVTLAAALAAGDDVRIGPQTATVRLTITNSGGDVPAGSLHIDANLGGQVTSNNFQDRLSTAASGTLTSIVVR